MNCASADAEDRGQPRRRLKLVVKVARWPGRSEIIEFLAALD